MTLAIVSLRHLIWTADGSCCAMRLTDLFMAATLSALLGDRGRDPVPELRVETSLWMFSMSIHGPVFNVACVTIS